MRVPAVLACLALAAAAPVAAAGTQPMTLLLATAHGQGSVEIGAPATGLHGRVWLVRSGGSGVAHGTASTSCRTKSAAGVTGADQWFRFRIAPNGRLEVWRYAARSGACTITVTLTGRGLLRVSLRGY
jgi:hypothetical protein